jgi:glutaredoxin
MARKIIVYSTPLCAPCEQLKGYPRAHDVAFEAKDLMMDEEAAAFIESHNIRSSPVLQVGEQLIFGPELGPEKVDEVLGLE